MRKAYLLIPAVSSRRDILTVLSIHDCFGLDMYQVMHFCSLGLLASLLTDVML
jgi:hypothetical protein